MASPISNVAHWCRQSLKGLYSLLEQPKIQEACLLESSNVLDELERFQIWAGGIGAFQNIRQTSSLDHRLQGSPKIIQHLLELLKDLRETLQESKFIHRTG
jgi:hypothetical protein